MTAPDDWWKLFKDPVLDDLERRLVIGNENLKAAVAQVASARATLDAGRSALFPTLSTGLSATRTNPNTPAVSRPVYSVSLSASSSWELDLWGRLSQAVGGAQATLQASGDALAAARLSAQATLAQTYFSMCTAETQHSLFERSVQAYQK